MDKIKTTIEKTFIEYVNIINEFAPNMDTKIKDTNNIKGFVKLLAKNFNIELEV